MFTPLIAIQNIKLSVEINAGLNQRITATLLALQTLNQNRMNKTVSRLFIAVAVISFFSCETDVDITAPEQDIPVAYAILDPGADTQFVKVNRLLQGASGFDELANDRNLAEYENLDISITKVEAFNTPQQGIQYEDVEFLGPLQPIEVNNKAAGLFYNPDQTLYYTDVEIEDDAFYKINITTPEGKRIEGYTGIIEIPQIRLLGSSESLWRQNGMTFIATNQILEQLSFRVTQPVRARALQTKIVFVYKDIGLNSSGNPYFIAEHELEIQLGQNTYEKSRLNSNDRAGLAEVSFGPRRFYELIENNVPDISETPEVEQRILDSGRIEITFVSDDIQLYSEVARPSESLLEDKPSFTNWSDGVGVIGSRATYVLDIGFNRATLEELKSAQISGITGGKGFCNPREPNDCLLR